ncbi:DUF192 domain-containing protein [Burkholderiaceae bacterium FT117]|uniref:DUF192 domain-containing protein n=1 Tax=Zeimonas sediminis TaxID=2944268 RepID=UPI00234301C4|nr:DUF192 domain-containing protein [Zeimonas sediminis]MCM5572013.1 DUF192 domain-containing protein [Zeimonas sediminis]
MKPGTARWLLMRPDGSSCALRLTRATGFVERLRGLLGRPLPEPGQGIWLEPCNAVHTLGMAGAIDLLFLDAARRVVRVVPSLDPWRAAGWRDAVSTVELRAGEADRLRIVPGSRLVAFNPDQEESTMNTRTEVRRARGASRPARAAAIAAVAAASLVSSSAKADASDNANLGYSFLDEQHSKDEAAVAGDGRPGSAGDMGALPPNPEELAKVRSTHAEPATSTEPSASTGQSASTRQAASAEPASSNERPDTSGGATPSASAHAIPVPSPSAEVRSLPAPDLAAAEGLYRGSRFDESLTAFRAIVDADPAHAHAWLRIGNILHRKREWFDALSAYRKAARPQADAAIREKAIYNVALLNLELARQAMKRLERIRNGDGGADGRAAGPRGAGVSDGALRHLSDQVGVSYRALAAARRTAAAATTGPTPVPAGPDAAVALAPAPQPGPRTPAPAADEKPVEVEIRQGGVGR